MAGKINDIAAAFQKQFTFWIDNVRERSAVQRNGLGLHGQKSREQANGEECKE